MKRYFEYGELVFVGKDGEEILIGKIYDETTCEDIEEKLEEVMNLVDRKYGNFRIEYCHSYRQ